MVCGAFLIKVESMWVCFFLIKFCKAFVNFMELNFLLKCYEFKDFEMI